jgi:uncharacterized protein YqhQ
MPADANLPGPFGGQALIEGVMIRGPRTMSLAVRCPDGRIHTESQRIDTPFAASLRRVPFVRGILTLYETFSLGIRALYRSLLLSEGHARDRATVGEIVLSFALIAVAAAIFFTGPVLMTAWIGGSGRSEWLEVAAEGAVRLTMLLGYVWFIGRLPEVQRVFAYHAAEHRAVHAYEHGLELHRDNVRTFPNAHPRCGTAFLLTVALLSFVAFMALGTPSLVERIIERIILMPLIAAAAYEALRAGQSLDHHPVMRTLLLPNLWLQSWTTRDPDDAQIDVAVAAMQCALAAEAVSAVNTADVVPAEAPADPPIEM